MNVCLLLSRILGSKKGPSTFTLSGTITGDEVEGATITLTGDASDSTTSAADGTYSFTGLSNGDYNVEPSLEGYIFNPTDIDVTIASADDDDNDFVSTAVYTISGTITGDVVEGVTITLTGDASDSTTTAADGTYSFTGVVDGSYTVTPTYTNLQMAPVSSAVEISGGDETGVDFVAQYLLLPYTYEMSSVAPTSGSVITQLDDWVARSDGLASPTITTSVADSNSYTPSGVTKGFLWSYAVSRQSATNNLPFKLDGSSTGVRVAWLAKSDQSNRAVAPRLDRVVPINATTGMIAAHFGLNLTTDVISAAGIYGGGEVSDFSGTSLGGNSDSRRYHWFRVEWNYDTNKISYQMFRLEDSSLIHNGQGNMSATAAALDSIIDDLATFTLWNVESDPNEVTVVKFWIGSLTDDWPV